VTKRTKSGEVRIVDSNNLQGFLNGDGHGNRAPGRPAGTALASERRRMAVLHRGQRKNDGGGHRQQGADHGFFRRETWDTWKKTLLHYIENTGDKDLIFLEMFKSSFYQDLSLSEWLTHTPPEFGDGTS